MSFNFLLKVRVYQDIKAEELKAIKSLVEADPFKIVDDDWIYSKKRFDDDIVDA